MTLQWVNFVYKSVKSTFCSGNNTESLAQNVGSKIGMEHVHDVVFDIAEEVLGP
jgi:hypothetical protein